MKNTFKALFVLILALVSVTFVTAADFSINRVDVDGITVNPTGNSVYVERGTSVPVTIFYTGNSDAKVAYDTRVKVSIGGYEYGDVEAVSHIFATHPNVTDHVTLNLKMPEDMKATDTYTLRVEMFDDDQSIRSTYTLFVKEARHLVSIYDVIVNPFNNVQAGQPLFVTVRLENMGDNVEDSIKVTASIPALGVQTSEYVDELVRTRDEDQNSRVANNNDATTTNELVLMIPENAKDGEYELKVSLNYNRGYGRDAESNAADERIMKIQIKGAKAEVVQPLVSVDSASQKAALGAGAAFKVSLGNPSSEARTYTVQVSGVDSWGTARVDPQTVTVAADKVGEAVVYVSPSESAQLGVRNFVVSVKDQAGNLVGEKTLSLEVVQGTANSFETLKEVLKVGFIALLAILVILGIVLVAKRLGGKEESVEGQTYYQ